MHRCTPLNVAFRSYSAGGGRTVIDKIDDSKLMQEMGGNFMKNESRTKVESPQNYGFTSVVAKADRDAQGNISMGAEGFITFVGGSRSFPVCAVMDDRRHRLKELEEGDTAMYRQKDDRQQIHMTKDGTYHSIRDDRVHRIALVPKPQQNQQGQQGGTGGGGSSTPTVSALDAGSSGGGGDSGGGQGQQGQKPTGQKKALDDNKKSKKFIDQSKDKLHIGHDDGHTEVSTKDVVNYFKDKDQHSTTWNKDGIGHKTQGNISRQVGGTDTTQASAIGHNGPTTVTGTLGVSETITAADYATSSDARIKSHIAPIGPVLTNVMAVKVRTFAIEGRPTLGVIAQELREVFPVLVEGDEAAGLLSVYEGKLGIVAIAALQEYVARTDATIAALTKRIEQLEQVRKPARKTGRKAARKKRGRNA